MFSQSIIDKLKSSANALDDDMFADFAHIKRGLDECISTMETSNEDERIANSECDILVSYRRKHKGEHAGVDEVHVSARIGEGPMFRSMGRVTRNLETRMWSACRDESVHQAVHVCTAEQLSDALGQLMTVCRPKAARLRRDWNRNGQRIHHS